MNSDKDTVREWMRKYAYSSKEAKILEVILSNIGRVIPKLGDRKLRDILSELRHDRFVASLPSIGYWHIVDPCYDAEEFKLVKASYLDKKSRALSMLADIESGIRWCDAGMQKIEQGQAVLF